MAEVLRDWNPVSSLAVFFEYRGLPPIVDLIGGYYHWYSAENALVGMAGSFMCKSWKTIEGSPHRQVLMDTVVKNSSILCRENQMFV